MKRLIKEFPFATVFALAGFVVGIISLLSTDFFITYNLNLISENPVQSLIDYLKDSFSQVGKALLKGIILGIVLGIVLGAGGFVIDFIRKKPEARALSGEKSQKILYRK